MSIADKIRERRKKLGLSQEQLGFKTELTQGQISRYENGQNRPTSDILIRLSKALNTTPALLMGSELVAVNEDLDETEQEILYIIRSQPPEFKMKLLNLLKVWVSFDK